MTFTLFEFLKDFSEDLVAEQPDKEVIENITKLVCIHELFLLLTFGRTSKCGINAAHNHSKVNKIKIIVIVNLYFLDNRQ